MTETIVTGGLLIMNAVRDLQKKEILLLPTLMILTAGILRNIPFFAVQETDFFSGLLSPAPGGYGWIPAMLPGGLLMLVSLITSGRVGFGDGLAVCAAGVWCGPEEILLSLFFAFLMIPAAAGVLRLWKRHVKELPFIPFLLVGFLAQQAMLWAA